MQPNHKGGKRGRKAIRSVKRKRYAVSFERRYGMSRKAWVTFKRDNSGEVANARREKALAKIT